MSLPFEIWASPEPTFARIDARSFRDQLAETGHAERMGDLDLLASVGATASRYPVLWERTAPGQPEDVDLTWARPRLEGLRERGVEPIVTLLHHGSGPAHTSLIDPAFPELFARYAGAIAQAFPWVRRWTPINEPLTTARFATLYGHWYPNERSDAAFGRAIVNEALAMLLGMQAIRRHNPRAEFVITEDLQSFTVVGDVRDPALAAFVAHKRERMYLSIELVAGYVAPGHPLYDYLTRTCGIAASRTRARRAGSAGARSDRLELLSQLRTRALARRCGRDSQRTPRASMARSRHDRFVVAAHARLGLPFGISEVHINANEDDRVAWLRERADDLTSLHARGLPVRMLGAWAAFGLVDWDSLLLRREDYREDGIFTFAAAGEIPQETAVARELRAMTARLPSERT